MNQARDVDNLLKIAKSICDELSFPYVKAVLEFVYELENHKIDYLRPTQRELRNWKKENIGFANFIKHLERKTLKPWNPKSAHKLWKIYLSELNISERSSNRNKIIEKQIYLNGSIICEHCGRNLVQKEVEIDHLIPVSVGGSSDERNLIILCKKCNRRKSNKYWIILDE